MLASIDFSLLPLTTSSGLISLFTLVMLEIVLGIDNIIFIAIICSRLPQALQAKGRAIGLGLALIMRVLLLLLIAEIASMREPLFTVSSFDISGRDLILFGGGMFLIVKTIIEISHQFKIADDTTYHEKKLTMGAAIVQIVIIDLVFSFDSILTAVGLSSQVVIMVLAVVIAMVVMLLFAKYVTDFISKFPSIKMLALCFLVVIGALLVIESMHIHIKADQIEFKSYAYAAMAFSLIVELLNIRLRNVMGKKENDD